jgi:hypothetical protein
MTETEPILTLGLEPTSMSSHSPPASPPMNPIGGEKDAQDGKTLNQEYIESEAKDLPEKVQETPSESVKVGTDGEHSPPASPPMNPTWGEKDVQDGKTLNEKYIEPEAKDLPEKVQETSSESVKEETNGEEMKRKKVVVVGLGMVGIAFM